MNWLPSKIRAGFPLAVFMNSMVDCNEMSVAANPAFLYNPGPVKTCQLTTTLHYNILYGNWCKLIKALDQMGPFHIGIRRSGKTQSFTFTFLSSLPCLHTVWCAISTPFQCFYFQREFHGTPFLKGCLRKYFAQTFYLHYAHTGATHFGLQQ